MTDLLRRITPDQVVEAYRKTGMEPARSLWLGYVLDEVPAAPRECGCGLSAVVIADHGEDGREFFRKPFVSAPRVAHFFGLDRDYAMGFVEGFDGKRGATLWNPSGALSIGREDGVAAAAAVFGSPAS